VNPTHTLPRMLSNFCTLAGCDAATHADEPSELHKFTPGPHTHCQDRRCHDGAFPRPVTQLRQGIVVPLPLFSRARLLTLLLSSDAPECCHHDDSVRSHEKVSARRELPLSEHTAPLSQFHSVLYAHTVGLWPMRLLTVATLGFTLVRI
jgi:hypothetical protein